jgi:hypothetical protein
VVAIEVLERWVPPCHRGGEVANLIAQAEQIAG